MHYRCIFSHCKLPLPLSHSFSSFEIESLFFQSDANHNISTSANYFLIGLNVVCSMFITSYMGAEITHQSAKIPISIYNSKWYKLQRNLQYQMLMILMQAQRPHILTGLKIFPCNYVTFKDVISTSGAYSLRRN